MTNFAGKLNSLYRTFRGARRDRESFDMIFSRFRKVLEDNNRSLEIIADMGDTLGGDYLFDIQYVRRSYADLNAAVGDSLRDFDLLTHDRYPLLRERFREIDEGIRHVVDETFIETKELVIFYEHAAGDRVRDIGGKNANLAEIKNTLKLNVPDAFALTTGAFDAFMVHNRIFEKIQSSQKGDPFPGASLHEVQERILQGEMPPDLHQAIDKAVNKIRSRCKGKCTLAVRSSAGEEDGEYSFAGQFETVLNVPLETTAVEEAYRTVVASLYSEQSSIYQKRLGYDPGHMKMAVGCVVMVDAETSGVLYSSDPQGDRRAMVINATWGLGTSIVEGRTDADYFRVKKDDPVETIETRLGTKDSMITMLKEGGIASIETPEDKKSRLSLSPVQATDLARVALVLEKHFKRPQDIEWAIDRQGRIFILQSRPLKFLEDITRRAAVPAAIEQAARIILKNRGLVVQKGAATGPVFIVKNERDIDSVPRGAILVAHHDSSGFVRVMTEVSAIITDIGTPTSHMAALCREFRIPTAVNAGNATQMLAQGQEVTVQVESEGAVLYRGLLRELVEQGSIDSAKMEELFEFRKKRYLLRYIAPLNLIDPLRDEFTPQACKTMHDLLRFMHEKSVAALIENAEKVKNGAIRLDLPIPAGIMLIDIGGGLNNPEGLKQVGPERIASLPLLAIITGMTRPGIWRSDVVPLGMNDFMASMLRVPDITSEAGGRVEQNMAIISREYANISLKFGYHFIVLDCFCGENARNNHIYFRFAGGATDISKRSRRLQLIAAILGEYGFNIKTKGDFIIARLANIQQAEAINLLDQLGRLFSYTRQLDAVLNDDQTVDRLARSFLDGKYELVDHGG